MLAGAIALAGWALTDGLPRTARAADPPPAAAPGRRIDQNAVEGALGVSGKFDGDVFVVVRPRPELPAVRDGVALGPRMGMTTVIAFAPQPNGAYVTGDLALAVDEVQPTINALQDANLDVTAVHPSFVGEQPPVTFVHFTGTGDAGALARGVRDAFDAIVRVRDVKAMRRTAPTHPIDAAALQGLGATFGGGTFADGVFRYSIGRPELRVVDDGAALGPALGLEAWIAMTGTTGHAALTGVLPLTPHEVPAVLAALEPGRVRVAALHDHFLREQPRLVFLHLWGTGSSAELARDARRALDALRSAGAAPAGTAPGTSP